jgi:serine/threonine protein kinase
LVNAADYDKRTPLHIAATRDHRAVAKILLAEGASINALDRWGSSPCGDAQSEGHAEMVRLLEANGGEAVEGHEVPLTPPLPQRVDWEVSPSEIDLENSELIGKGSFGEIRKAIWRGTPVAVKTIRPSLSNDRMVVKDFTQEVELLVKLRHPNIVQFLGAVTRQPPLMLITEYLAGGDLYELLSRKKEALPAPLIVKYSLDIARGMCYLHNGPNAIIHRDLKPRNVILDEAHELKVGDFGLSKLIKVNHLPDVYKMTGETGSYRYMAPEVFLHEQYDKSVDVFSFAMVLYEMFEGAAPFEEEAAYDAAQLVADEDRRPEMKAKTYPLGMQELIWRCWSRKPKERPPFDTIVEELQKMEENFPQYDRIHLRDLLHIRRQRD